MDFDIETTIEDSIRLKKALQISKFTSDKLEKQIKEIKSLYQEQIEKNKSLKNDYCELQRKYQQSFTESIKDSNSLISQIQQLKKIIDEKQRDMELIQIKLIPSLDQDMLRVKLITQMEGPYQQTVETKDKQIDKLKNKVIQLQRNLQITSLGFKSKIHHLKKENSDLKIRFEQETNRLMQELNISLSRYEVQSIQASIVKNQKKQIQQLKTTIEFVNSNEQKNLQEIKDLKEERKNLLEKLMMFNSKEALLLEGKHNLTEIQTLKEERIKHIRQIQSLKTEKQKMARQISKLQQDKTKMINQQEKQMTFERSKFMNERNQMNSEIHTLKQELRMFKNYKIEGESDREATYEKIKTLQKQVYLKTRQIETLRLESSRTVQRGENEQNLWHKSVEEKCQNEKRYINRMDDKKQNDNKIINKRRTQSKDDKKVQDLKRQNEKLKKKLGEANDKIMELIRGKMKYGIQKDIEKSPQKDQWQSNAEKPMGVFLQYEDCGFTPLIEPTLYTYHHSK